MKLIFVSCINCKDVDLFIILRKENVILLFWFETCYHSISFNFTGVLESSWYEMCMRSGNFLLVAFASSLVHIAIKILSTQMQKRIKHQRNRQELNNCRRKNIYINYIIIIKYGYVLSTHWNKSNWALGTTTRSCLVGSGTYDILCWWKSVQSILEYIHVFATQAEEQQRNYMPKIECSMRL